MSERTFRIWRGNPQDGGDFVEYTIDVQTGMVVLDCIHEIQKQHAPDLACRWNCKAGKCGSCSMEINGKPALSCMTRMNTFEEGETITVQPLKTFPVIRDGRRRAATIASFAEEPDRFVLLAPVALSGECRRCRCRASEHRGSAGPR